MRQTWTGGADKVAWDPSERRFFPTACRRSLQPLHRVGGWRRRSRLVTFQGFVVVRSLVVRRVCGERGEGFRWGHRLWF
jgi:hypothetical protein